MPKSHKTDLPPDVLEEDLSALEKDFDAKLGPHVGESIVESEKAALDAARPKRELRPDEEARFADLKIEPEPLPPVVPARVYRQDELDRLGRLKIKP